MCEAGAGGRGRPHPPPPMVAAVLDLLDIGGNTPSIGGATAMEKYAPDTTWPFHHGGANSKRMHGIFVHLALAKFRT